MNKKIIEDLRNKKLVILGFGKEGQSMFHYLRKLFPDKPLSIADSNEQLPGRFSHLKNVVWLTGSNHKLPLERYDLIIKSPGIILPEKLNSKVTSQSDLFLQAFGDQVIGVTGTKGKSTTASLIYHIIQKQTSNTVLVGNIGTPPLEEIEKIDNATLIVNEISAHQLENAKASPSTAIVLNLFEEHLDRFADKSAYYRNKLNILKNQTSTCHAILNDEATMNGDLAPRQSYPGQKWLFAFEHNRQRASWLDRGQIVFRGAAKSETYPLPSGNLPGKHNLLNSMAAIIACRINGIAPASVREGLVSFTGLEHRLEEVGIFSGIRFFNDSISTIPQTTIEAIKTLPDTQTLILGGYDRHINYSILYDFLKQSRVQNLILSGPAGNRIYEEYGDKAPQNIIREDDMKAIVEAAFGCTTKGSTCLLSPAASSYDQYKNFEERGKSFKEWIKKTGTAD
ncbi:MAG: UDP-N-acetylmuramoyl-L-alanine--D-glutamate ligase [Bacteroidales bacterium]|nr:UDP-N-acetylmuramoyl-L-alanine--D-glutamate ligase [Bacteroidales bacterium]MCF8333639.1 UDP-N-acetylmuramoyl-L-alanine--D-glutamate ligase [Bacteroidales bacterium]